MKKRFFVLFAACFAAYAFSAAAQTSRLNKVALTGTWNGWRADSAIMELVANDTWQTEVYVWNQSDNWFKFVGGATWSSTNVWGDTNQTDFDVPVSGTAEFATGDGNDIQLSSLDSGFYRFRFNDLTFAYSIELIYTDASDVNLIENPAFEQQGSVYEQAQYWEFNNPDTHGGTWGRAERKDWGGYCGQYHGALLAQWNTWDEDFGGFWQEGPAEAGYTYEASCWIWADRRTGTNFYAENLEMKIEFFTSGYSMLLSDTLRFQENGQTWTRISLQAKAPYGTAWARFVLSGNTFSNEGALRFDNVQLRKVAQRVQNFNDWYAYTNDGCYTFDWKLCEGKVISNAVPDATGSVILSEYVEGSSYNKALELYNGTDSAIDLDAGNYVIAIYNNGSSSPGYTAYLTNTVGPEDTYVVVAQRASGVDQELIDKADQRDSALQWFNGDDAIVLWQGGVGGTVVDSFGQVGVDPGSSWGGVTVNHTLRRQSSVTEGRTNYTAGFDPFDQWLVYDEDDFSGLGEHLVNYTEEYVPSGYSASIAPGISNLIQSAAVNGIGTVSFWYRALDGSTPMTYEVQTSENGSDWTTQATLSGIINTTYQQFLQYIYEPQAQYMRIYHTAGADRLLVDDIQIDTAVAISRAQPFDAWTNATAYGAHTSDDAWDLSNGRSVTNQALSGNCGWLITNSWLQSPLFEDGAGIITFSYKRDDNSTNPAQFALQYSTNGTSWETIKSYAGIGNAEYIEDSVYSYLTNALYIRFINEEYLSGGTPVEGALLLLDNIYVAEPFLYRSQNFEEWPYQGSYGDSEFQGWSIHEARVVYDHAFDGKSAVMRETVYKHAYLQSPYIPGGLGTLSFKYACWEEDAQALYDIMISADGTNWVTNDTLNIFSTDFQSYAEFIEGSNVFYYRIQHRSGADKVIFDDLNIAQIQPPANVSLEAWHSPASPYTTNEVSLFAGAFDRYGADNLSVTGYYRIGTSGVFSVMPMVMTNGVTYNSFTGIAEQASGTEVQYYIGCGFEGPGSELNSPQYYPPGGPTNPLSYRIPRYPPNQVWINEFNYLNDGWWDNQIHEFVEICGPAGWDISGWQFEFYIKTSNSYTYYATYEIPDGSALTNGATNAFGFYSIGDSNLGSQVNIHFNHTNWFGNDYTDQISDGDWPSGIRIVNEGGGPEHSISYRGNIEGFQRVYQAEDWVYPDPTAIMLTGTGGYESAFTWVRTNDYTINGMNDYQTLMAWNSPTLVSPDVTNITKTSASMGATILATNGSPVTERGVYWYNSTGFNPPASGYKVSETGVFGTGVFRVAESGFTTGTSVYYRAFAINSAGTNYTREMHFMIAPHAPTALEAENVGWSSFDARWETASTATNYLLDVAEDSGFSTMVNGFDNRIVGDTTSFTVTGLTWDVCTYYYRVRYQSTDGISSNSNIIAVDDATPPLLTDLTTGSLTNAGFEEGDWTAWYTWGGGVTSIEDFRARSGSYHAKVFGNDAGSPVSYQGFYQRLAARSGQVWRASIWIMSPSNDYLQGGNKARVDLVFQDSGIGELARYHSDNLTTAMLADVYYHFTVVATAPVNTAYAQLTGVFEQAAPGLYGAAFYDDADLTMNILNADGSGAADLPDLTHLVNAADNCPSDPSMSQFPLQGAKVGLGSTSVWIFADGCCGLSSTTTVEVTVEDVTGPTVTPPADIQLESTNDIPAVDTNAVVVTDNDPACTNISAWFVADVDNGGSGEEGDPLVINRIYAAMDCAGNPGMGVQVIRVGDPVVDIMQVQMDPTNMIIRSTGSETMVVVPEYTTNLLALPQVWFPVPVITNTWVSGTNITRFGLPDTNAGWVIIRVLQEEE